MKSQDYSNFCLTKIFVTDSRCIRLCIQRETCGKAYALPLDPAARYKLPLNTRVSAPVFKGGRLPRSVKFKLFLSLLLCCILSCHALPSFAVTETKAEDEKKVVELKQDLIIEDGRALVPLRSILEELGAYVFWDANTKTITCTKSGRIIELKIGEPAIYINKTKFSIDVPAKIVDGCAFIPIRALGEALGAEITYNADSKSVTVLFNENESILSDISEINEIEETANIKNENGAILITAKIYANLNLLKEKLSEESYNLFQTKRFSSAESFLKSTADKFNINLEELKNSAEKSLLPNEKDFRPYIFTVTYDADEYDDFISIISTYSIYTGGAHPSTVKMAKTYYKDKSPASLNDVSAALFNKNSDEILVNAKELFKLKVKNSPDKFLDNADVLIDKLPSENFYITKEGIFFFFNQYDIAPYSSGIIEVKIPFE